MTQSDLHFKTDRFGCCVENKLYWDKEGNKENSEKATAVTQKREHGGLSRTVLAGMDGARIADGLGMRRGGRVNRHSRVFGLSNRMAKAALTDGENSGCARWGEDQ